MRVLVLGSGGREHAIVDKLLGSPSVSEVLAAPGNGGTAFVAENVAIDCENPGQVLDLAEKRRCDLVVVGPEGPLVAGVVDHLTEAGIPAFGPSGSAARMEGSKAFAKGVMERHGIPTGGFAAFTELQPALEHVDRVGAPVVVKADGLAAGKGVTVATDLDTARGAVIESLGGRFGEAGSVVVVEEFLAGQECSLLAFCDGRTVVPMVPAQDYKRALDGDEGPNTGGMGVYSPVPAVDDATLAEMTGMLRRTVDGLAEDGIPYSGVLYGGFILTEEGPKVLEFNARFGDPETQVILPRLESDLLPLLMASIEGTLAEVTPVWSQDVCVSIVLASGGYPGNYENGKEIFGVRTAERLPAVKVYHAGTRPESGHLLTAGGRVLNVTARGATFAEARDRAYEAVSMISFEGMHHRTDIALRAVGAEA